MTWEIIVGIITLVGFLVTIGKLVAGNTAALTRLEDSISRLDATLAEQKKDVTDVKDELHEHDVRITLLERK